MKKISVTAAVSGVTGVFVLLAFVRVRVENVGGIFTIVKRVETLSPVRKVSFA